ncbi:MAG TPA: hypothetical protein VMF62_06595 [Acetobacteraceae bacterium]|nr:hypothetical protein [Acetobacteraceae bacterium]
MAYVPGYDFDIFISYPREVNFEAWVEKFHTTLKARLDTIHPGTRIYFDKRDYRALNHKDSMLRAAGASALFLPILVPAFVIKGKFTLLELEAFQKSRGEPDRIVIAELYPFEKDRPAALDGPNRNKFYQDAEPYTRLTPGTRSFQTRIEMLAGHICERLDELAARRRKTILLARCAREVRDYAKLIAEDLRASGFEVLPEEDYPDERRGFEESFKADLTRADLFVQLLGPLTAGESGPEADELALSAFQYDEAKRVGVPALQWAARDTDPAKVSNALGKRLLEGPDVRVMSFNEFKKAIKEALRALIEGGGAEGGAKARDSGVYIAADRADGEYVDRLKQMLIDLGFRDYELLRPEDSLANLKDVIETAYAFVLLDGNADREFVNNWLRNYRRLRSTCRKHPPVEALVYAPPPRQDKASPPDVHFDGLHRFMPPEEFPQKGLEEKLRGRPA